jgi:hypothetical protein
MTMKMLIVLVALVWLAGGILTGHRDRSSAAGYR